MSLRVGRDTHWTSHEIKRIYRELKRGNKKYCKTATLCTASGCHGGFRVNNSTGEITSCPKCDGWGVLRKV